MIDAIRAEICSRAPELAGGGGPSLLQIGGASWRGGRVHFAVFGRDGKPALFARVMRNPGDDHLLEREYELLVRLAGASDCKPYVPEPLFLTRIAGRAVLCERAARGARLRLSAGVARASFVDSATLALVTRIAVAVARAASETVDARRFRAAALEPLREFWLGAGGSAGEIDPLLDEAVEAAGAKPRLVVTHGDFIPKNILVDGGAGAALIDWETAEPLGLPLIDLFYFLTRCAYVGGPLRRAKADRVRAFYAGDGRHAAVRVLESYCDALELPRASIAPAYCLHFLYKAKIKADTTSLDNRVTQVWLDLFRESVRPGANRPFGAAALSDPKRASS